MEEYKCLLLQYVGGIVLWNGYIIATRKWIHLEKLK